MAATRKAVPAGVAPLVAGPAEPLAEAPTRRPGAALVAAALASRLREFESRVVVVTTSEARADELGRILASLVGEEREVLILPPWDCLPYDHASPSRESQGRRLAVLARLAAEDATRQVLVVSPEAALQRLPPAQAHEALFTITRGQTLDRDALERFVRTTGYLFDDRIDEPGEIGFLGEVIDVFPPTMERPCRISLTEGCVASIRLFDPISQRSDDEIESLVLTAASERLLPDETEREPGVEHRLALAGPLDSLFDRLGPAGVLVETGAVERCRRFADHIRDAHETARTFGGSDGPVMDPTGLYLVDGAGLSEDQEEDLAPAGATPSPRFGLERNPGKALARYVADRQADGRRIVVAAMGHELKLLRRFLKRQAIDLPEPVETWAEVTAGAPGGLFAFVADPASGFDAPTLGVTMLTATDVLGGRVHRGRDPAQTLVGEPELRVGDVVIHEDHGLGVLQALERIEIDGLERDVLRLEYHDGATLLTPVEEFGRIWRYGSEPAAVSLDRLGSKAWRKRRAEVSREIDRTADELVALAAEKACAEAVPVIPPRQAFAAFVSRFPFPESPDQATAIEEVLADLASGRPMDRLICGDVGFGKTEVALRAAAAVALTGQQVAVIAPTTVLARQHFETFRRRFAGSGIEVAQLSRLVDGAEARAVKQGLADGRIRLVVGTQALAAETVAFSSLGLVIIDEEQHFGSKLKEAMRARASHVLTMTATPIPRTLQTALVGLVDVSVIATPPARRRPIRTLTTDLDNASLRTALLREKRRGGQSFVVCPLIEDLEPMRARLEDLVPELRLKLAHGKMPASEVDDAMVDFAEGQGDVLLATNIIESGLDVPRANTIVVWRPDRFGLGQLHQLRGRVGRGRSQGFAYLLTDPDEPLAEATRARLAVLEAFDRLGSGFSISARDLDLRGGGDIVGDQQAGHMKKIGAALYQSVLARAVKMARGEPVPPPLPPPVISASAHLPADYIPDPVMRINLYARLASAPSAAVVEHLDDEISDRFGPAPPEVSALVRAARLSAMAAEVGVSRISRGPRATAFTLDQDWIAGARERAGHDTGQQWIEDRLVVETDDDNPHDDDFVEAVLTRLAA